MNTLKTPYFNMTYINNNGLNHYAFNAKWLQVTVINGKGLFNKTLVNKGETFITSYNLTEFNLSGKVELIVSYIANI
jgi:mannose-6-phosphate isomerase class I